MLRWVKRVSLYACLLLVAIGIAGAVFAVLAMVSERR